MSECYLHLDGQMSLEAQNVGAQKEVSGEVVFNTGMTGYPESLTDPSYRGQILVCTYPLIGNYGVVPSYKKDKFACLKDFESGSIKVQALVVSECSENYSHYQARESLSSWLKRENIPLLTGIDTRKLTQILREKGTLLGAISSKKAWSKKIDDPNERNLAQEVSIGKAKLYGERQWKHQVLAYDLGMKENIVREFMRRKVKVLRVPWNFDFRKENFNGIFISNGPGDPAQCSETTEIIRQAMQKEFPIFGICMGNHILARAASIPTFKLKYGHRGQNQPCQDLFSGRCLITSQNHGYAVQAEDLKNGFELWFENLNDQTCEGIKHKKKPFFSVQFHPEAKAGPQDSNYIFDEFIDLL